MTMERLFTSLSITPHKRAPLNSLLLLFSLGILCVSYFPVLPSCYWLVLLIPMLLLIRVWQRFLFAVVYAFGIAWGVIAGHQLLAQQLDADDEGKLIPVNGWIEGIPLNDADKVRFVLRVDHWGIEQSSSINLPEKILLSWYQHAQTKPVNVVPGEYWRFHVRLKRPRGMVNPGGFDYQAWLLRRGLGATGYIVQGEPDTSDRWIPIQARIDHWRWHLQQWVRDNTASNNKGILVALLIGDTGGVEKSQWQQVQQTGISHLIAISGLHVGFLALVGYLAGLYVGRCLNGFVQGRPAQIFAYLGAIVFALFYSALAGFNIPTVRTLIMLGVFYLAAFFYRRARLSHIYFMALALVLVIQPLAAFDIGFWLSFIAVALLILVFSGRYEPKVGYVPFWSRTTAKGLLSGYCKSQWVMFIGLLVPLSMLVNTIPLLSPVANFVAIPLVTFFVVPCLLLGAVLAFVSQGLGGFFLMLAAVGIDGLMQWLDWLIGLASSWHSPTLTFSLPVAAVLGAAGLVLLLPVGLVPRWWGYVSLVMGIALAVLPLPDRPELQLTILDVGQGSALVASTPNHHLVFDTGPQFSKDFDGGTGIVLPYLRSLALRKLDALVISHWDKDHAGGYQGLVDAIPIGRIYWGEPSRHRMDEPMREGEDCHQSFAWRWDNVEFQFLQREISARASANHRSCVLLIRYAGQNILLPGDLDSKGEWALLRGNELPPGLTLVVAAHHGSRSSSNPGFVAYTSPDWVAYSAGYKNQHNHPHPQVQARYAQQGSRPLNTAWHGALVFRWYKDGRFEQIRARDTYRRYWFDVVPEITQ
ncbi:DNA internalization-related competence protein ComEC/Rec2 [Cellvibrio japonicus Ueda107]|uniref:DNA internalization-related competence protein ComEC/Rec2 n=2 Tax=Cellvibrio japonicus TaxID=155077 RepID=B3PFR5_CELJU|nr:DNA internalization-related competence protein ComEC/Rec2 [Cellvibrio japonicus Ueda107]QEI12289.1 DNA internalization-related competence protein ComEC/Rec2 [Cellvibrio japonicus]QEI15863.1 DNA internalization-related competence protein ComEC/Rec2 [Cellvibrio japonicus]QEI19441.1 DNA internalization-related competence protein ComEC/Rec2 [Cellvibrio japonicus]